MIQEQESLRQNEDSLVERRRQFQEESDLKKKHYIFKVDRPKIVIKLNPVEEELRKLCPSKLNLNLVPSSGEDLTVLLVPEFSQLFMRSLTVKNTSQELISDLLTQIDSQCSIAEQNILFSLLKRQKIGRSSKVLYYSREGMEYLLKIDLAHLKTPQSYRKSVLIQFYAQTLNELAQTFKGTTALQSILKKELFVKYYFKDFIKEKMAQDSKHVIIEKLLKEVFSIRKLKNKVSESKNIKGVCNISYLYNLIEKSPLLRSELHYFVSNQYLSVVGKEYPSLIEKYAGQTLMRLNHYLNTIKSKQKDSLILRAQPEFLVEKNDNLEVENEREEQRETYSNKKYRGLIISESQKIQTCGYFKFPWALEEHKMAKNSFIELIESYY